MLKSHCNLGFECTKKNESDNGILVTPTSDFSGIVVLNVDQRARNVAIRYSIQPVSFKNGETVKLPKCEINAIEFAYVAFIFRTEQRHLVYICKTKGRIITLGP